MRRKELAEQHRQYMEEWAKRLAEGEARRKREQAEVALQKEAEAIAYRCAHAVELEAEKIALAVWPEEQQEQIADWAQLPDDFDDDHPF